MNDTAQELPSEAITALERGSKIEAIKHVRFAHNVGLKEAKEMVEQYLETSPDVKSRMTSENSKNGIGLFLLIVLIGFAVYYFFIIE